jgi:hypothetical protein
MKLGDKVRDIVTGFDGVIVAKCIFLYKATQFEVQPDQLKADGEIRAAVWFEETRLVAVERDVCKYGFGHAEEI